MRFYFGDTHSDPCLSDQDKQIYSIYSASRLASYRYGLANLFLCLAQCTFYLWVPLLKCQLWSLHSHQEKLMKQKEIYRNIANPKFR